MTTKFEQIAAARCADTFGHPVPTCLDCKDVAEEYLDAAQELVTARDAEWRAQIEKLAASWPPLSAFFDPLEIRVDCRSELLTVLDAMGGAA